MKHQISEMGMTDFEKKMSKLTKKAEKLGLPAVGFVVLSDEIVERKNYNGVSFGIRYFTVEVFGGSPTLAGWSFIAKIEHGENGNVVFSIANDVNVTEYRNAENHCDHCNVNRFRSNTFIIRHSEGQYKQVGSSCLSDFMGNPDAEKIAEFYASEWFTTSTSEDIDDGMDGIGSGRFLIPTNHYVAWVVKAIEKFGWRSSANQGMYTPATKNVAIDMMFDGKNQLTDGDKENAQAIIEKSIQVLESKNNLSEYEWNLLTLIKREYIKINHIGFVASVVGFYNRAIEVKANAGSFVGVIGQKVTNLSVSVVSWKPLETMYGISNLYTFLDGSGNTLVWFSSNDLHLAGGDKIVLAVATIKDHKVYNGINQTIITRCKIAS
jgi:hypothetical protein